MKNLIVGAATAFGVLLSTATFADESEKCAIKAQRITDKGATSLIKTVQKICKSVDSGAEVAFDDPGNDNGTVEAPEIADAADFAKLTEKINKAFGKANDVVAAGGADCLAHFAHSPLTFPIPTVTEGQYQTVVAANLNANCH